MPTAGSPSPWIFILPLVCSLGAGLKVAHTHTSTEDGIMASSDPSDVALNEGSWPNQLEESQLDGQSENEGDWSPWSEWSSCSRTCDGGVSSQTRRCDTRHGCRGESIRHRICNMQPCPEPTDFRGQQCSAFKNVKYHGENYEWEPHYDSQDPCSLTCRAKGQNIVAQLFPKVRDGTRCREGSLDMCINGKCQPVGCDLQLGSTKKVDACGVCGGNGSSCGHPSFYWQETPLSNCSVTCGGGLQMSKPVCKNKVTGREVDERLCDVTTRPAPTTRKCNVEKCPATWITEDWGTCSATCSGGVHQRPVYCGDTLPNGTIVKVEESRCSAKKPKLMKPCNPEECPRWYETYWSGCSVTCGQGHQTRKVICRDFRGHITEKCDPAMKPTDKQPCTTGLPCVTKVEEDPDKSSTEIHSPLVKPYPPLQAQRFTGTDVVSSEPRYTPDPWGACSVSCGEGIKKRKVLCKIFLEFSRTEAVLPDKECPGKRPAETERCVAKPCSLNRLGEVLQPNTVEVNLSGDEGKEGVVVTYSWRQVGFTPCSATCLGGVRESIVQCVRDHDQAAVSPFLCDVSKKPDVITQTCNDQPCLPRWNITEFTRCTKTCGGGIQTRQVQCVHDVTRGNTLVIPNSFCPEQMPKTEQTCGLLDCRPQWVTSAWTKCSRSCGSGTKTRKIECKQLLAIGQYMVRPTNKCPARQPHVTKKCNTKACTDANFPEINFINQSYVQSSPALKKISLKVGGKATVFKGTRLKIKCPVKKYDRARILWAKDHIYLESSKRFRISRKGTLKIRAVQYSDSGVYNCVAGGSKANITIEVKPKPVPYGSSEEDRTVERPGNSIEHFVQPQKPNLKAPPRRPPKLHTIEEDDDESEGLSNVMEPKEEFSHEHTVINTWPPAPNNPPTRIRPPKTKTYSEEKPNSLEANIKGFDTWEFQHGSDVSKFNDENGGSESDFRKPSLDDPQLYLKTYRTSVVPIANTGGVRAGDDPDRYPSSSVPHLQRALEHFKPPIGAPRGRQMGTNPLFSTDEADDNISFADGQMGILAKSFVLGKGKAENIKFDWMVANWSTCSESCGGNGVQIRAAQCMVRLHNVSITVDNNLCESAELDAPPSFQKCGIPECPHWETGPYSACNESRCFGLNTSVQRRYVRCLLKNGTLLNPNHCDNNTRPREKRECYNVMCRGTWKVGPWSECNAKCDEGGIRSRILRCVWYGTQRAAGIACRDQPRPSVVEDCKGSSCSSITKCTDLYKYCSLATSLNMCRIPRYKTQCCKTCRGLGS